MEDPWEEWRVVAWMVKECPVAGWSAMEPAEERTVAEAVGEPWVERLP